MPSWRRSRPRPRRGRRCSRRPPGVVAYPAVRARGTIGGSVALADPAADYPVALQAANATIEIGGPAGARQVKARDFFKGLFETALGKHEIVVAIHVPPGLAGAGSAYEKLSLVTATSRSSASPHSEANVSALPSAAAGRHRSWSTMWRARMRPCWPPARPWRRPATRRATIAPRPPIDVACCRSWCAEPAGPLPAMSRASERPRSHHSVISVNMARRTMSLRWSPSTLLEAVRDQLQH